MLILSRKVGETVILKTSDGDVTVMVTKEVNGRVLLGFEAPKAVVVMRSELLPNASQNKSIGSGDSLG